jgi:hypothetical protein
VEQERGARVRRELATLAALVVAEERQPALVGALQEDHPDGRAAVRRRRRERDGFRERDVAARLLEPTPEELDGVVAGVVFGERPRAIHEPSVEGGGATGIETAAPARGALDGGYA